MSNFGNIPYVKIPVHTSGFNGFIELHEIEAVIKAICAQYTIKLPVLMQPIRNALTGTTSSPSVYDMIVLLGKKETVSRITKFIEFLK